MALPTTIISNAGTSGPGPRVFKSAAGNFYAVVVNSTTNDIQVFKATDPTDSWTAQDTGNQPTPTNLTGCLTCVEASDKIELVNADGGLVRGETFNMADDTWGTGKNLLSTGSDPEIPWACLVARPNGELVCVYNSGTDQVMGGPKERVDCKVRSTGGTWGSTISLDAAGDIHYFNPVCVNSNSTSNDVHIMWCKTGNTQDPPAQYDDYEGRTLRADDSLSTVDGSTVPSAETNLNNLARLLAFNDGAEKIAYTINGSDVTMQSAPADEDGSNDLNFPGGASDLIATSSASPHVTGETVVYDWVGPDANGDFHALWSNTDDSQDIWYNTSTDDMDTWGTEAEELGAVTCNYINATIYVRGTDTVIAYVYDDGGTVKYNEKVIIEGGLDISPPLITAAGTVYSPTITTGAVDIAPSIIAAAGTVFSPTVSQAATQDISPGIITAAGQVYSPTITTTVDIAPGIISAAGTVYAPTLTTGAVDVSPALIAGAGTVFSPTVTVGAVDISPALIAATGAVYTPTLTTTYDITPPQIVASGVVFNPTITTGSVDISPALIGAAGTVFSPTVAVSGGTQDISPAIISATGTVFSPTVDSTVDISPALVSAAGTVFTPTVTVGAVDISPALIPSAGVVFAPTITQGFVIAPDIISASGSVFTPTLTLGAVDISPDMIVSAGTVFSPVVALEAEKAVKIEFADEAVINTNGGAKTFYFNGTDYFEI